jgi:hypothetical protein
MINELVRKQKYFRGAKDTLRLFMHCDVASHYVREPCTSEKHVSDTLQLRGGSSKDAAVAARRTMMIAVKVDFPTVGSEVQIQHVKAGLINADDNKAYKV